MIFEATEVTAAYKQRYVNAVAAAVVVNNSSFFFT
jgi:hypothetical protein